MVDRLASIGTVGLKFKPGFVVARLGHGNITVFGQCIDLLPDHFANALADIAHMDTRTNLQ